jgi:hypothetical protein
MIYGREFSPAHLKQKLPLLQQLDLCTMHQDLRVIGETC